MRKADFLKKLKRRLWALQRKEKQSTLQYYKEVIEDRIENGMEEEAAVASLGSAEALAEKILSDAQEQGTVTSGKKILFLTLLILGSPLWLSLLLAAFSVVLSLYIVLWSLVFSFWAVIVSFGVSSIACFFFSIASLFPLFSHIPSLHALAIGCILSGGMLLLLRPCLLCTKAMAYFTEKSCQKIWTGIQTHLGRS